MTTAATSAIVLYGRPMPGHEQRVAHALAMLQSAAVDHAGRIVQASSLGAEDMVITDLIARHALPIPVATLDTGKLFAQSLSLIDRIREHWGIEVQRVEPDAQAAAAFEAEQGPQAMYRSHALRLACCSMRKTAPLQRMLAGRSAWITGLRREPSGARQAVPFTLCDDAGRHKLNPLADWSWADVWHYIASHGVPYNPLHDRFMPSIGCAPCTRAIAVGEDFRAGHWWWEQGATEAGSPPAVHPIAAVASARRAAAPCPI